MRASTSVKAKSSLPPSYGSKEAEKEQWRRDWSLGFFPEGVINTIEFKGGSAAVESKRAAAVAESAAARINRAAHMV